MRLVKRGRVVGNEVWRKIDREKKRQKKKKEQTEMTKRKIGHCTRRIDEWEISTRNKRRLDETWGRGDEKPNYLI